MVVYRINLLSLVGICWFLREVQTFKNETASGEYETEDNSSFNSNSYEMFNVSSTENRIDSEDISAMENDTLRINYVSSKVKSIECADKEIRISEHVNQMTAKKFQASYPFSVSIQRKSSHYSSGALVNPQWVLTAAADFYNVRESIKLFKARLGSVNCKKGGVVVPIRWVEIHPSYIPNKPAFDVALLKLASPVRYNEYVSSIPISNMSGKLVSANFLTTYWPRLIIKGKVLPLSAKERFKQNSMRFSTQKMIPRDNCLKVMQKNNVTLEHSSLCLEPIVTHHTPCMPDPGAPLVARDQLWGITSGWTNKKCTVKSPSIFTRLSSPRVRSWLQIFLDE